MVFVRVRVDGVSKNIHFRSVCSRFPSYTCGQRYRKSPFSTCFHRSSSYTLGQEAQSDKKFPFSNKNDLKRIRGDATFVLVLSTSQISYHNKKGVDPGRRENKIGLPRLEETPF